MSYCLAALAVPLGVVALVALLVIVNFLARKVFP